LLALKEEADAINLRIWKAQLKILFPFIEHRRNTFIDLIRKHLSFVPSQSNLADMEFAKIGHHIERHIPAGQQEAYGVFLQIASAFGDVRNDLAHRTPASAESLQAMFGASESMDNLLKYGFSPPR
jgi:hypothetical protein